MSWRALIVDDERLARLELRTLLATHPSIEVVAEAADHASAAAALVRERPTVVFLDIQLGATSGFELLDRIDRACRIVFVTAYESFAVRAFEVNAVDYLLKPVHPDRLAATIARLEQPPATAPLAIDSVVFLPSGAATTFVTLRTIVCILAEGDYTRVITSDSRERLVLRSLADWERRLPGDAFARVHRSAIANLGAVVRSSRDAAGHWQLHIPALARPLTVSRRYATRLRQVWRDAQ